MNYFKMETEDVCNGDGIRVSLWVSGCDNYCYNCQNPQTWDASNGIVFDKHARETLFQELDKEHIAGLTLSGGDPLYEKNLDDVLALINEFNYRYKKIQDIVVKDKLNHNMLIQNSDKMCLLSKKTIWLYTGWTWEKLFPPVQQEDLAREELLRQLIVGQCDILVDGPFIEAKKDLSLPFRGSSNQRLIDIKQSLRQRDIILWK